MELLNLFDYETHAQEHITQMAFDYYAGGANDQVTLQRNRAAYDEIRLWPKMLRDVSQRDTSVNVLGSSLPAPFMIAPMGFIGMAHPEGELAVARTGWPMTLSTMSTYSMEDVAEVATGPLWFQLYIYKNRDVTRRLVERAAAAGYQALVLTVDTPLLGRREQDIRNRFHLPNGLTAKNLMGSGMEDVLKQDADSGLAAYIASLWDASISWKDVEWLRSITELPIVVKGILRADDARLAVEHGASGILVSNHGGRQLDTAPATIEALPAIAAEVGNDAVVLLDGGIRRGTDIVKALALGAQAVMLGRPVLWGLGISGQDGVEHVLALLREEFELAMALCGACRVEEITPDLVG